MKTLKIASLLFAVTVWAASVAFALPPNSALTVTLSTVSPTGQLTQVASQPVTSDAGGKIAFSFSNVPTGSSFLMVQIMSGNSVLRRAMVAAPAANGSVKVGVDQVTDRQALAMTQTISSAGTVDPTQMMALMNMVRSGAISDTDAQNFGPLGQSASAAFEKTLTDNGVTAAQLGTFKTNLINAMRDYAAGFQQAVTSSTAAAAAAQRGAALSTFRDDVVNAGVNAGISSDLIQLAFGQAGSAAASAPAAANFSNPDIGTTLMATWGLGAMQVQLQAQARNYTDAMSVVNASNTLQTRFANAKTTLGGAIQSAQQTFEQAMFADQASFPSSTTITGAVSAMLTRMQTAFNGFFSSSTASDADVSSMLTTMASRMAGMGGMMGGMSSTTLSGMGIGMMTTSPTSSGAQNWTVMMVAAGEFVSPTLGMTYTPITNTLTSQLTTVPTPPSFASFADPYKSLLELQYDLMLTKLLALQQEASLGTSPTLAQVAQIAATEYQNRAAIMQNISGVTDAQKSAMVAALTQPQLL